jgi:hypothetical protein
MRKKDQSDDHKGAVGMCSGGDEGLMPRSPKPDDTHTDAKGHQQHGKG